MKTIENLCIALSLRSSDSHLLGYGEMLIERGIAKRVCFVHVIPRTNSGDSEGEIKSLTLQIEQTVSQAFNPENGPSDASYKVLVGPREDRMLEYLEEQHIGLVLLGHTIRESSGKRSFARRMAMASSASVWMVPVDSALSITKVLAPVDLSQHSADSLSIATGIALQAGLSECTSLHVYYDQAVHRFDDHDAVERGNELAALQKFIRSVHNYGVAVEPQVEEGSNPAKTILRIVDERHFDLVVLSTRGRSQAASILLGSEASQVIMEARVPVLAIKHQGSQLNFLKALTSSEMWHSPNPVTN